MAKKTKPAKSSKKDPAKTSLVGKYKALYKRDKVLWLLLTTGCLLLIGGGIFGSIVLYEKWQFNKAEKALDSLYADIVTNIGQPVKVEKTKSCSYSSAKYSKGDLSCSIGYNLQYTGNDTTALAQKFINIGNSSDYIKSIDSTLFRYENIGPYIIEMQVKGVELDCGATVASRDEDKYISLSCNNNPLHQVFPLRN